MRSIRGPLTLPFGLSLSPARSKTLDLEIADNGPPSSDAGPRERDHGPPQVVAPASDADKHFVQMPGIARSSLSIPQLLGKCLAELEASLPDRFLADGYATFG